MAYWVNPGLENLILKVFQDIDFLSRIGILKNSNDNFGLIKLFKIDFLFGRSTKFVILSMKSILGFTNRSKRGNSFV